MTLQPLATTTVGSFPRPLWLADTQRSQAHYKLSGEALSQAMDDATVLVLRQQEQLGLDIATAGEMRRRSFMFHVVGTWWGVVTRLLFSRPNLNFMFAYRKFATRWHLRHARP